jgi:hypothetical protein
VPLGSPAAVLEAGNRAGDRRRPCGEDGLEALLVCRRRRATAQAARARSGPDLGPEGRAGGTRLWQAARVLRAVRAAPGHGKRCAGSGS